MNTRPECRDTQTESRTGNVNSDSHSVNINTRLSLERMLWAFGSVMISGDLLLQFQRGTNLSDKMEGDRESARVPMKMGEFSVMDTEFDNIKDRFDSEMRRMEDEMNKFRSELISRQADTFRKTSTR